MFLTLGVEDLLAVAPVSSNPNRGSAGCEQGSFMPSAVPWLCFTKSVQIYYTYYISKTKDTKAVQVLL